MTREEYNKSIEAQLKRVKETLIKKNKEYSTDNSPLHNFHQSAKILRVSPKECALAFMVKHLTSIIYMTQSDIDYPMELWREKLGDAKNYMILIECLVEEEKTMKLYDRLEEEIEFMKEFKNDKIQA
jgi:gp063